MNEREVSMVASQLSLFMKETIVLGVLRQLESQEKVDEYLADPSRFIIVERVDDD
jgi:hypothetical protein